MSLTEAFCRYLGGITWNTLPPAAVDAARRLVLDGIAVAVAGSREQAPRILAGHLGELGGNEQATAINFGFRTSTVSAAYLNGASMHVLDYEPMWSPPNHALSTTLPAVLALAETLPVSGAAVLSALIRGVEAQGRLRVASRQDEPRDFGFHPPGMVGVIGSAIAAGHLLGLDLMQTRHAIGIAASRSGTVLANAGTMTKCTHCGMAVAMGLDAALMAKRGFTANAGVIEAPHGYAHAFFGASYDGDALTRTGVPLRIVAPGYAMKMFPSQYATHFVITAALETRAKITGRGAIKTVEVVGPVMQYVDRQRPLTGLEGKFSFQYTAACALLDGAVRIDTFTDEHCRRPDIVAFLPKVRFTQSPEIPAALDRTWVEINVELSNGDRVSTKCRRPRAAWGDPIAHAEHLVKVHDCMRRVFDERTSASVIDAVERFDHLDSAQVRALMRTLGNFGNSG